MKTSYREILEKRIIIIEKEYDKLYEAYHKQRKYFPIWLLGIILLYSVILLIIINDFKN